MVALAAVPGIEEQRQAGSVAIRGHAHPSAITACRAPLDPALGRIGVKRRLDRAIEGAIVLSCAQLSAAPLKRVIGELTTITAAAIEHPV